jgi:hypothetical protein
MRATANTLYVRALPVRYWAVLLAALFYVYAPALANAGVLYIYDGKGFVVPPSSGDYAIATIPPKRVSGSFSVEDAPLNCDSCDLTDPKFGLLGYDFSDGVNTFTSEDPGVQVPEFVVSTGATGLITAWSISFNIPSVHIGPGCDVGTACDLQTMGPPQGQDIAHYLEETSEGLATRLGTTQGNPLGSTGTWSWQCTDGTTKVPRALTPSDCGAAQAPEPGSLPLTLVALLATWGIGVVGRCGRAQIFRLPKGSTGALLQ